MSENRFRGEDIAVFLNINSRPIASITAILSFNFTEKFEKLAREYLNETAPRFDEIYKGVEGKIEFDIEGPEVFTVIQSIKDRAQRRVAGVTISVKMTIVFPNGQRQMVTFPNVSFGDIPITTSDRSSYGKSELDFSCSNSKYIRA